LLLNVETLHGQKGSFREFCTLSVTLHPIGLFYTITPSKERHPSTPEQQNIDLIKGLYEASRLSFIHPLCQGPLEILHVDVHQTPCLHWNKNFGNCIVK